MTQVTDGQQIRPLIPFSSLEFEYGNQSVAISSRINKT